MILLGSQKSSWSSAGSRVSQLKTFCRWAECRRDPKCRLLWSITVLVLLLVFHVVFLEEKVDLKNVTTISWIIMFLTAYSRSFSWSSNYKITIWKMLNSVKTVVHWVIIQLCSLDIAQMLWSRQLLIFCNSTPSMGK